MGKLITTIAIVALLVIAIECNGRVGSRRYSSRGGYGRGSSLGLSLLGDGPGLRASDILRLSGRRFVDLDRLDGFRSGESNRLLPNLDPDILRRVNRLSIFNV